MARKLCIVIFCLVALLLLWESHAETAVSTIEDATSPPTDGTSEGSLQPEDVQRHITRNHACSSAISAVLNACVCLLELMETKMFAHAITTGRPKEEDPNALETLKF
ncbi:hypothetical protein SESBI_41873 [Sesbania bispinosa]|nr:hypothetical protein SESBI_41873 [Sesbania bispinosa]